MKIRLRAVASLMAALPLVAGCSGGPDPSPVSGDPASSEVSDSFVTDAPPPEDTDAPSEGTDPPPTGTTEAEAVSLEVPGLPVGGGASEVSETLQCAPVAWSGPSAFLDGVVVTIESVSFDPSDAFVLSSETCPDAEPCLGSGFQLTPNGESCVVPVAWTGTASDFGSMSVSGSVTCPPAVAAQCQAFRDSFGSGSIQLVARPADEEESLPSEPSEDATEEGDETGDETDDETGDEPSSDSTDGAG